ncbi:F-box domain protein [Aspergillus luchuensis]|uniref:F-box domain protein n=1 Tax=Aspergillus kawachii TaxID=1069201 RepID=A0A146FAH4_ASPKA|nr:F-box domain protein [Aspergillus luchuensis]
MTRKAGIGEGLVDDRKCSHRYKALEDETSTVMMATVPTVEWRRGGTGPPAIKKVVAQPRDLPDSGDRR